ncbi:2Fe-2S iron-sulfur cluster-binding protein [Myxococcota bacterium]
MAKVRFVEQALEVDVPRGTTVLGAAERCGAPLGAACGGVGACSTCHVSVEQGLERLSFPSEAEEDALNKAFDVRPTSRLACQARLGGELEGEGVVSIRISRESLVAYQAEHPENRATGEADHRPAGAGGPLRR